MSAVLKSNPSMMRALTRKRLEERLAGVRSRVEADVGCGLLHLVRRAERGLFDGNAELVADLCDEMDEALVSRAEELSAAASLAEQSRAANARGEEQLEAGNGAATRDGWHWLLRKREISITRRLAGDQFREVYAKARTDGIKSCLYEARGGGDGPVVTRTAAAMAISDFGVHVYKATGGVAGDQFIHLLEAVCGRGETLRDMAKGSKDIEKRALVLEAHLMTALDMAAVFFRLVTTQPKRAGMGAPDKPLADVPVDSDAK